MGQSREGTLGGGRSVQGRNLRWGGWISSGKELWVGVDQFREGTCGGVDRSVLGRNFGWLRVAELAEGRNLGWGGLGSPGKAMAGGVAWAS